MFEHFYHYFSLQKYYIFLKPPNYYSSISIQYFSQRYLTTLGGKSFVVGRMPFASKKARSVFSQRRKVSGLTPAARESSIFVRDFIRIRNFELGIMRFGLSVLLNKSLLVGFLVGCGSMVLAVRTTLQDVFTMNLADVKLAIVLQFANETRYWGLKGYLHVSLVFSV